MTKLKEQLPKEFLIIFRIEKYEVRHEKKLLNNKQLFLRVINTKLLI
jgi:hypothetical protein